MKRTYFFFFLLSFLSASTCFGFFSFKAKGKPSRPQNPAIKILENEVFRFVYTPTDSVQSFGEGKDLQKKREVSYKFVCLSDSCFDFFLETGWARVLLKDEKGNILGEIKIAREDWIGNRDAYGFVWIDELKINKIERFQIQALPDSEIPADRKKVSKETAEPSPTAPVPSIEEKKTEKGETKQVTPPADAATIPAIPQNKHLTNQDIAETLKEFEHQLPTQIQAPAATENKVGDEEELEEIEEIGEEATIVSPETSDPAPKENAA
jgi:hypothetical protein